MGTDAAIAANAAIELVTNTVSTLFNDVTMRMNGVIVSQANGCYGYRSYIDMHFLYLEEAKCRVIRQVQVKSFIKVKLIWYKNYLPL